MPLRGLIGSDVLKYRDDWKVIDSPFGNSDPIVLLPAIKPDVALLHAPMADRFGNVWIGRQRELATMAHAAEKTIVTVEKIHDGNLLDDPRARRRHAARLLCREHRGGRTRRLAAAAARPLRRRRRASRGLCAHGGDAGRLRRVSATSMSMNAAQPDFRDEELLADVIARLIGDVRHVAVGNASPIPATAALLARERGNGRPYVSLLGSPQAQFLHRRRARIVRLRRARPHRRVLSLRRTDRRPRQRQSGLDRRLRTSEGALPRLVRLGLSLLRGAESHLVPHRAFAPHAGAARSISSARRARARKTSIARAGRSRWSPTAACSRSPTDASRSRACIPATRSRK